MKKYCTVAFMLILAFVLMALPVSAAGALKINIQGTEVEATVVDDYSSYSSGTQGAFTFDGETLTATLVGTFVEDYALPLSNGELTKGAKYLGFKVTSEIDDLVYFSFQGKVDETYFITASGDPIILVNTDGSAEEAFVPEEKFNGRYCIELPEEFDGYVIIPTSRLAKFASIDTGTTWTDNSAYTGNGIYIQSTTSDANVIFDDFFAIKGTLPELTAPTETPQVTATPTTEPEQTQIAASATAAQTQTAGASATASVASSSSGQGTLFIIIGAVAAVVAIAAVVFFVLKKKGKQG